MQVGDEACTFSQGLKRRTECIPEHEGKNQRVPSGDTMPALPPSNGPVWGDLAGSETCARSDSERVKASLKRGTLQDTVLRGGPKPAASPSPENL